MLRATHIRLTILALLLIAGLQTINAKDDYDIYDLSLDENLVLPEIKNEKQADKIQDYQLDMAVAFKKSNYDVEIMRDDEVIVITIPASQLFDANDTVLNQVGEERLHGLLYLTDFIRLVGLCQREEHTADACQQFATVLERQNRILEGCRFLTIHDGLDAVAHLLHGDLESRHVVRHLNFAEIRCMEG